NIMNALFMVVGAGAAAGLLASGLTIPQLFGVAAVCNAAVAIYIFGLVPEFLLRFVVWLLVHSVYQLDKKGLENIPHEGPALIICNHVSFVDALVIAAACRRPIRFVMDHRIFRWPVFSFVFKVGRAIPIAPAREDPVLMEKAFEEVSAALAAGELVGIFPEGRITHDGELGSFRPGISRILARNPVPVIPMALSGLWGSIFSRRDGKPLRRFWTARPFRTIAIAVGVPVPAAKAQPGALRSQVLAMRGAVR
ncbi:MAG: 1-acyl-sn-glycerol-3-phosphate acyltransferase, partial [Rhodocyclaceae bacterium]